MALVDTREAARILGVSARTLERWRMEGQGPAFLKIGSYRVTYDIEDLDAFKRAARRTSTSDPGPQVA
jgi:DNA-binding transcriptional MerR regulator